MTGEFGIPTVYKPTGVVRDLRRLFASESRLEVLKEMNVSAASRICLELTLRVLRKVVEAKERLATEILFAGEPLRKMNAYLGLVPRVSNSGGKSRPDHITRESRKLTRTILTQCVHHVAASSESWIVTTTS